jgi:hypothetical protein
MRGERRRGWSIEQKQEIAAAEREGSTAAPNNIRGPAATSASVGGGRDGEDPVLSFVAPGTPVFSMD